MPLMNYLYERRRGLAKTAGVLGGVYFASSYAAARLQDMREAMVEERNAKDNLRRRFAQNEQDAAYMVLGLLPSLSEQILEGMDVEALTLELQNRSRTARHPTSPPAAPPYIPAPPPDPPLSDSATGSVVQEEPSHNGSELAGSTPSLISYPSHDRHSTGSSAGSPPSAPSEDLSASSQSWIRNMSPATTTSSLAVSSAGPSSSAASVANEDLSASIASSAPSASSSTPSTQTKAELWREVKMLTFTRTLTVLYSMTLLTLFSHVQLAVLNRIKYVQSVHQLEREARDREAPSSAPISIPGASLPGVAQIARWLQREDVLPDADEPPTMGPETELKYLTLSWWLLHVGWKDVGERVRRAVEEVFDDVSLKEHLAPMELHRLLMDVRRRVEHEVTFEGKERRTDFLSTLLPSTPETLHHVMTSAGLRVSPPPDLHLPTFHFSPSAASAPAIPGNGEMDPDPAFTLLLAETSSLLSSPDFAHVIETALDRASEEVLLSGLLAAVFGRRSPDAPDAAEDVLVPKLRVAAMLPGLTRWSRLALTGLPNELVDRLGDMREIRALSAIVFTSY